MKTRDSLVRSKQFLLEEARRRAAQIELMAADLARLSGELDAQIAAEERRTGIADLGHFAYSTFARAARQRRENLAASLRDLEAQRERAVEAVAQAEAELAALLARLDRGEERILSARERAAQAPHQAA
jgi:flagellar FliJ protein